MRSVLGAGFIFWGLFASFALIVALYVAWMWWTERGEPGPPLPPATKEHRAGGGEPEA